MMRKLGEFMLRSQGQEVLVLTLAMVMSVFISPLSYLLSGTPLALLALRKGPAKCIKSAVIALMVLSLGIGLVVPVAMQVVMVFALMIWIPVLCMSVTLRTSESQAMMLILAAVMAVLITVSIHWSLGDVEGWWREMVLGWIGTEKQTKEAVDLREAMLGIVPFMNAFMMGAVTANMIISVLVARWWQAQMFFPGAFKKEFLSIRLPLGLLMVLVIALLLSLTDGSSWQSLAKDIVAIITVVYSFEGIARIHRGVSEKGRGRYVLTLMYVLIVFMTPQMVALLGLLGIVDSLNKRPQKNGHD